MYQCDSCAWPWHAYNKPQPMQRKSKTTIEFSYSRLRAIFLFLQENVGNPFSSVISISRPCITNNWLICINIIVRLYFDDLNPVLPTLEKVQNIKEKAGTGTARAIQTIFPNGHNIALIFGIGEGFFVTKPTFVMKYGWLKSTAVSRKYVLDIAPIAVSTSL